MKLVIDILADRLRQALKALGLPPEPMLRPATEEKFGDYQSNCAMGVAKAVGKAPRKVAEELVAAMEVAELCEPPEVAGPGFINFRLRSEVLSRILGEIEPDTGATSDGAAARQEEVDRLGIPKASSSETIVVDFSSPNLAKEMHVGHLRSTVIGECICRMFEFEGHRVIRENHVGDWGTQFGMLAAFIRRTRPEVLKSPDKLVIQDLESFYIEAKALFDKDAAFKKESQEAVVALQQGDGETRAVWKAFCDESLRHCHEVYRRLGVRLIDRGESFYNDLMPTAIERLARDGHTEESEGALCVFPDRERFSTREGAPLPLIIRKADGGYNYATSDFATILHRVESLGADRIYYVVGIAQKLHFELLFAAVKKAGWVPPEFPLEHVAFGNMLSASGTPFKTREGGTAKLKNLLDEGVARAYEVVKASRGVMASAPMKGSDPGSMDREGEERPALPESDGTAGWDEVKLQAVAEAVGLAAIVYFDLSHGLKTDYKFDLDQMVSLEGNTAPYMMYAYARIRAIGRKAGVDFSALPTDRPLILEHPAEIALAKAILKAPEVIRQATRELKPNLLTEYLYSISKTFSRFYDRKLGVRVVDAEPEAVRVSRLRLCDLTARTLRLGLHLLGIRTLEQM